MKKPLGSFRGQIAVLYAGMIVGLLGATALATDVAVMYLNWQHVQKGVDAAATAGANYLTGLAFSGTAAAGCGSESDDAEKAACTYAANNGLAAASLTITEPTSSTIKVMAQETSLPYYFGKVLGLSTYSVSASATAGAAAPVSTVNSVPTSGSGGRSNTGMFPVGLQCTAPCNLSSLDPGQSVSFGAKFVGGLAPGNWQFLDSGNGDSGLGADINSGMTGSYTIGQTIHSETGNKGNSTPVVTGLADRLSRCPTIADPCSGDGNPNDIPAGDSCLVIVPAVDYHSCNGNCAMTIEGFALIYLEQSSTGTNIQGCFVKSVVGDTLATSGAPGLGSLGTPTLSH